MSEKWKWSAIGLLGIAAIASTACHRTYSEMLIRTGITSDAAPQWVRGDPQDHGNPDEVYFVGRSVAFNVLDENAAVAAARQDVYEQITAFIASGVDVRSVSGHGRVNTETGFQMPGAPATDTRFYGVRESGQSVLPGPELAAFFAREAWLFSSGVAGDLTDRGIYFEQWDVRDDVGGLRSLATLQAHQREGIYRDTNGMMRYKCWVRMSIPRERLEARIAAFEDHIHAAAQRYVEDRARTIRWAEENRALQIRREEDARLWAREDQAGDREEGRELRRVMGVDRVRFSVTGD